MVDGIDTARQEQTARGDAPGLSETALGRIAQAVGPPDDPAPPERVGPYRLLREIGAGGMGVVYLAEQDEPLRRTVALKLIKPGMDSRDVIARFAQERRALALLEHRNVARVLDAGTTPLGRPYFVMEYVSGEPITRFCDARRLTIRQRLELFAQACEAVQHAHQKAIIHRDLKPSNILVTDQAGAPEVKVIDFGVAKALDAAATDEGFAQVTQAGKPVGTPQYMSPEQACGADVDTRSDIYSLGVVLYELLTGALPFEPGVARGSSFDEIRRIIRDVNPPRPSTRLSSLADRAAEVAARRGVRLDELQRELRGELEWIPLKATRADAAHRYPTASAFAQEIANYLADRPLLAGPESTSYRLKKYLRRNRGAVIAASAVIAALLIGVVGTTVGLIHARAQRREAQTQSAIAGAVSRFQSDMLASADPQKLLGEKVTVLQAVTAAVAELDAGKLAGQPLVEASVRTTIGQTLLSLGRYNEAETNFGVALKLRRAALGAAHADVAQSLDALGVALHRQGKWRESEPHAREALAIQRKVLSTTDPQIARTLLNLALVVRDSARYVEAETMAREAVAIARESLGPRHAELGDGLVLLAWFLGVQAKFDEAEPTCREGLAIYRVALPPEHPNFLHGLMTLGWLLELENKIDEAESPLREALEICRKRLPPEHPETATILNRLGWTLRNTGRVADAEPMFREALAIRQKALGPRHPLTALSLNSLAWALKDQRKVDEAEPLFRASVEIYREQAAPQNTDTAIALNSLAHVLGDQGKLAEAEAMHREALEMFRKVYPSGHPNVAEIQDRLVILLERQGRLGEAEVIAAELFHSMDITQTPPQKRAMYTLHLGRLLAKQGRWNEAEAPLRMTMERCRAVGQSAAKHMCEVLSLLADVCDHINRPDEATRYRAELARLVAATQPATSPASVPALPTN